MHTPRGGFVVRADPSGVPTKRFLQGGASHLLAHIQRRLRRDIRWSVQVRHRQDDPFGTVIYEETFPRKADALAAVDGIRDRLRKGEIAAP